VRDRKIFNTKDTKVLRRTRRKLKNTAFFVIFVPFFVTFVF